LAISISIDGYDKDKKENLIIHPNTNLDEFQWNIHEITKQNNSSYHFNQHVHEQIKYDILYVTQGNVTQICNTYVIEITKSFKKWKKRNPKC